MPPCTRPGGHLSPPTTRLSRKGSPSDRSDRSDQSADSSEKGCTSSSLRSDGGSKPARKRASKPKVRTGCISCKRRHVKCDEGKPSCAECERLGLMCEGYAPPKVKRTAVRTERLLLPKLAPPTQTASPASTPALRPADEHASILPMPCFGFEFDDDDRWYFALFRDQVALELSPYHQSHFWTRTSLRDSMVNKCVRHSILSIGAFARALMELREEYPWNTNMSCPWWPPTVLNRHHQAALVHQAKALSHLRSYIEMYGIDSHLTMTTTLLFIVFENMQGNYHSSGNLIRSGIKVLTNMRSLDSGGREHSLRHRRHHYLTAPRDEFNEMADMYTRHSVTYAYIPFSHGKLAYHLLFTDDADADADNDGEIGESYFAAPYALPAPRTLEQARRTWDYLSPLLANFHSKAVWHNLYPDYEVDVGALRREQATHLARLSELGRALDSLHAENHHHQQQQQQQHDLGLELLRLHHTLATAFASCCLDPTEEAYDGFLPQFEDCLRRGRAFVEAAVPRKVGFSNEAGILVMLAFVGFKCRVRRVRLEVLELLGRYSWREGSWDSTSLANAVTGLMKLEGQLPSDDAGAREATTATTTVAAAASRLVSDTAMVAEMVPPAGARYTWTNMFWDFENRHMIVEYTKLLPNEFGEFDKVRCMMGA
ncbi:hypothetical protein F4775DRAFT_553069 [Biscogniauxia sp. FL1348]|nr:hypothetical protein F4775DRAFT_553069 [Biscogniauxia sp. FL1348]